MGTSITSRQVSAEGGAVSDRTRQLRDEEQQHLSDEAMRGAARLINEHRDKLDALASALLRNEVLERERHRPHHGGRPAPVPLARATGCASSPAGGPNERLLKPPELQADAPVNGADALSLARERRPRGRLPRAPRARCDPCRLPADRPPQRPRADRLRGPRPLPLAARPGRAAARRDAGRRRPQRAARGPRGRLLGRHDRRRRAAPRPPAVRQRRPRRARPPRPGRARRAPALAPGHRAHRAGRRPGHPPHPGAAAPVDRPRRADRRRRRRRRLHVARVRRRDPPRLPQALPRHGHRRRSRRLAPGRPARHRGVRPRGRRARGRRGRRAARGARGAARRRGRLRPGLAVRPPRRRLAARARELRPQPAGRFARGRAARARGRLRRHRARRLDRDRRAPRPHRPAAERLPRAGRPPALPGVARLLAGVRRDARRQGRDRAHLPHRRGDRAVGHVHRRRVHRLDPLRGRGDLRAAEGRQAA